MWAKHRQSGFTIVELLIVIVVIAILAAITVVAFNGVQNRARSSAAVSAATQVAKTLKLWQVDNEGVSPSCSQFYTSVTGSGSGAPTGTCSFDYKEVNYQYSPVGTTGGYCVTTTVATQSYKVSTSTAPEAGGCSGHGQGGVAAISNLVTNPSFETNMTSWNATSGSTLTRLTSAGVSPAGSSYISLSRTASGDVYVLLPTIIIEPSTAYTISFYAWASAPISIVGPTYGLQEHLGTYRWIAMQSSLSLTTTPQRFSITGTSANDATTNARIILRPDTVVNGASVYYDGLMVTKGSNLYNFADGNSSNWTWNGTVNNSTSTGPPL